MNKYSFGYEDTDKKIIIELYGIEFEIKGLTSEKIDSYEKLDKNDVGIMEKSLEEIIGVGAIEKINNKRISDGYEKMTIDIIIAIWTLIFKTFTNVMSENAYNSMNETLNGINKKFDGYNRKNYNNRNYRKNYRRY